MCQIIKRSRGVLKIPTTPDSTDYPIERAVQNLSHLDGQNGERPVRKNHPPVSHRERNLPLLHNRKDRQSCKDDPHNPHRPENERSSKANGEDHFASLFCEWGAASEMKRQEVCHILAIKQKRVPPLPEWS